MKQETYIVAVKRGLRDAAPSDWQDRLRRIKGVRIVGGSTRRLQIEAAPETVQAIRDRFGSIFHIEPIIPHTFRGSEAL